MVREVEADGVRVINESDDLQKAKAHAIASVKQGKTIHDCPFRGESVAIVWYAVFLNSLANGDNGCEDIAANFFGASKAEFRFVKAKIASEFRSTVLQFATDHQIEIFQPGAWSAIRSFFLGSPRRLPNTEKPFQPIGTPDKKENNGDWVRRVGPKGGVYLLNLKTGRRQYIDDKNTAVEGR